MVQGYGSAAFDIPGRWDLRANESPAGAFIALMRSTRAALFESHQRFGESL